MDNSLTVFTRRIKFNISSRFLNHNTLILSTCWLAVLPHQGTEAALQVHEPHTIATGVDTFLPSTAQGVSPPNHFLIWKKALLYFCNNCERQAETEI